MEDFNYTVSAIIGLGYLFYFLALNFNSTPQNRNYNKLFNTRYYSKQLVFTILTGFYGFYRASKIDAREVFYLLPIIFLSLFWFFNKIHNIAIGKNILIADRYDSGTNLSLARTLFFLLTFIPVILVGLIMNYLNS